MGAYEIALTRTPGDCVACGLANALNLKYEEVIETIGVFANFEDVFNFLDDRSYSYNLTQTIEGSRIFDGFEDPSCADKEDVQRITSETRGLLCVLAEDGDIHCIAYNNGAVINNIECDKSLFCWKILAVLEIES